MKRTLNQSGILKRLSCQILVIALLASVILSSESAEANDESRSGCGKDVACISKGWTAADRAKWYWTSQGSRLIPLSWARALINSDGDLPFWGKQHFRKYGYLWDETTVGIDAVDLPIGFAIDTKADKSNSWIGMNCAACHTADIGYKGLVLRVDGAPALSDFQTMLEELVQSVRQTLESPDRWQQFAEEVVENDDHSGSVASLRDSVGQWLANREKLLQRNYTAERYGFGRLDAVGHILNKIAHVLEPDQTDFVYPSDAPVSYPHIWNASQHESLQWNGIVGSGPTIAKGEPTQVDIGGLGRNVGEVIGVFAELEIKPRWPFLDKVFNQRRIKATSVRLDNLVALEQVLMKLQSPVWPEAVFGPAATTPAQLTAGQKIYDDKCERCHRILASDDVTSAAREEMQPIFAEQAKTDPWMACNAVIHGSQTGDLEGASTILTDGAGKHVAAVEPTAKLLETVITRSILKERKQLSGVVGKGVKKSLSKSKRATWRSVRTLIRERREGDSHEDGVAVDAQPQPVKKSDVLRLCETLAASGPEDVQKLLQYKARPLNGIWATAPYLHNGSVPNLWSLLLPEQQRPLEFEVGSNEFDPELVGFAVAADPTTPSSQFRVHDAAGKPIPGNSNKGHNYGTDLSEKQRWDLMAYLRSL